MKKCQSWRACYVKRCYPAMGMIRVRMCEDKSFSRINSWCKVYKLYLCAMKYVYLFIGSLSLILGVIGIFLPILPTTPFLLLSAALFFRSSPRAYDWLLTHKYLGPYIRSFREDRMIPLRAKIQNHFHFFTLADGSALRRFAFRIVVAADRYGSDGCLCDGLYPVFQDTPIYRMKYKSYST